MQYKSIVDVLDVEELVDISASLEFVEFVLES
jgi:hypothetical protein